MAHRVIRGVRRRAGRAVKRVIRLPAVLALAALGFGLLARVHGHPLWWISLGRVQEARHQLPSAVAAYRRAAQRAQGSRGSSGRWHSYAAGRRVQAQVRLKDWPGAIAAGQPFARATSVPAGLAVPLARAYREVGDWPASAEVLRRATTREPGRRLVEELAETLEWQFLVPFSVSVKGEVRPAPAAEREAAWSEAVKWRTWLVEDDPGRASQWQKLGALYERAGHADKAAAAYERATARLAESDGYWALRAAHEWAYRLAHVRAAADGQAGRAVSPAGPTAIGDPIGYFEVQLGHQGLQMKGFLLPGQEHEVEILLDGQVLRRSIVDTSTHRPWLFYVLGNEPLDEFPERSLITMRAAGRPLLTTGGTEAVEVRVPDGTGAIAAKLAAGEFPTKRGSWPISGEALEHLQTEFLRVYRRVRDAFDAQGRHLFLCYGSLLGCHREGRFIPGDDDFDASYVSYAPDPAAFRRECYQVARELTRQGLDITMAMNGRLFKAGVDGVWVDITPMWFYRGRAFAFNGHAIRPEAIEPVRTTEFLGLEVYVPNQPEVFLADAYGPGWRTPRSDFQHYRPADDHRIMSQMWTTPSEVREFTRLIEDDRARHPGTGRFVGVGVPEYPGFSWLTPPDGAAPTPP